MPRFLRIVPPALMFALCLAAAPTSTRGDMIDQSFTPTFYNFGAFVDNSVGRAQTFTVGTSGLLDAIGLDVLRGVDTTSPLVIDILATTNGVPDPASTPLATVSLDASQFQVATTSAFTTTTPVTFSLGASSILVTTGEVLAISLRSATSDGFDTSYLWTTSDAAATPPATHYDRGEAFYHLPITSASFGAAPTQTSGFETFVGTATTAAVPEPSSVALAGLFLAAVGLTSRRRARG